MFSTVSCLTFFCDALNKNSAKRSGSEAFKAFFKDFLPIFSKNSVKSRLPSVAEDLDRWFRRLEQTSAELPTRAARVRVMTCYRS